MRYIISDIHGCYEEYLKLLERIHFSQEDELYVLGDAVDRGPEPIKVIKDMMARSNVTLILGNHDFIMYKIMKKLSVEVTEENYDNYLASEDMLDYHLWQQDGGQTTSQKFKELGVPERMDILDYISEASVYEKIENDGKVYILVHAGLSGFDPDKDLADYALYELLEERTDYSKRYYPDESTFFVTGHTPTRYIKGWEKDEVFMNNGHIALDCACFAGGKLAAFCIETESVTYVDGRYTGEFGTGPRDK